MIKLICIISLIAAVTAQSTTCTLYTGQSVSTPVTFQLYEENSGLWLTQAAAAFSSNPQTLLFGSSTPQTFNFANPSNFQGGIMGILNYNNANWNVNGGYGGIFTQNSNPSFYVNIIPNGSGGVTLKAVQTNYNSNQYNLNLFVINGQRTLSYGNINAVGTFKAYICSAAPTTPAPTTTTTTAAPTTTTTTTAPTTTTTTSAPTTTAPPSCTLYTGQAVNTPVNFQVYEANSGLWFSQATASFSNNPQILIFGSSTSQTFKFNSPSNFQGGFMGILNFNNANWDINGGYGGVLTQSGSPSFYINVIPNGSGGVSLKAVQANYNSNQYALDLNVINGQRALSYGNINTSGGYRVYIC
jgi:hypothetical protein